MVTRLYVARSFMPADWIAGTLKTHYADNLAPYDSGWEDTPQSDGAGTASDYRNLVNWLTTSTAEADRGDAQAAWEAHKGSATTDRDTLLFRAVSPPMAGSQTITGTLKGQFAFRESNSADDCRSQMSLRVIGSDGVIRGTLWGMDTNALGSDEFGTTASTYYNRQTPRGGSQTVTNVAITSGDRLLLEVGFRSHATGSDARGAFAVIGTTASSGDLPEDQTTTSGLGVYRGWIELSHTITWGPDDLEVSQVIAEASMTVDSAELYLEASQVIAEASVCVFYHGWGIIEVGDAEPTDSDLGTEPDPAEYGELTRDRSQRRTRETGYGATV